MIIEVYKHTSDSWYPEYKLCTDEGLVEVSLINASEDSGWLVCAWGKDDMGLEKYFSADEEKAALTCFMEVIGMRDVTVDKLVALGFTSS